MQGGAQQGSQAVRRSVLLTCPLEQHEDHRPGGCLRLGRPLDGVRPLRRISPAHFGLHQGSHVALRCRQSCPLEIQQASLWLSSLLSCLAIGPQWLSQWKFLTFAHVRVCMCWRYILHRRAYPRTSSARATDGAADEPAALGSSLAEG